MKKINLRAIRYIDAVTDALLIYLSFFIAYYIRFVLMNGRMSSAQISAQPSLRLFTLSFTLLLVCVYYGRGRYYYSRHTKIAKEIADVVLANTISFVFYIASFYIVRIPDFSRLCIAMYYCFSTFFVCSKRICAHFLLRRFRDAGRNQKHVIVIGSGTQAKEYIDESFRQANRGVRVDGYISDSPYFDSVPYLGCLDSTLALLETLSPDEVIISLSLSETEKTSSIINACEQTGIRASIIPYYNDYLPSRPQVELFGDCRLINIRSIPLDNLFSAAYKRLFDIVFSMLALIIASPIMLITAMIIALTDPGPIFFSQERVGRDKKPFKMYKFRSMRTNIDHSGWSTADDPRRTRFGSFIRKFSIDELPQFWNVLKGDMSLVGPRPEIPNFVRQFSREIPRYLVRQQVRPGITGWAQINGYRGDTSIEKRIEYDIWYIENWTWLLDIKILLRTAFGGFINAERSAAKR